MTASLSANCYSMSTCHNYQVLITLSALSNVTLPDSVMLFGSVVYMYIILLSIVSFQSRLLAENIKSNILSPSDLLTQSEVPYTLAKLAICYCILHFGY